MRYSYTTAVLATLTIGQAAAGSIHHRHNHDRRAPAPSAAPVAEPQDGYYNGAKITFSAGQKWGTWGGAAPAAASPAPAPVAAPVVDNTPKQNLAVDNSTPEKKKAAPKKAAPAKHVTPQALKSPGNSKGGKSDLSAAIFKKLNAKPVASNGMINDKSGEYSMDLCNESGEELGFYCWPGSSGWNIGVDSPIYAATIPAGMTHSLYMGSSSSKIACAALHSDGRMDQTNGIPVETQIELTMCASTSDSTFDVSQLETASGHYVKMESSVCTAESNGKCSYQCNGSAPCGYVPGQVHLKDCLGSGTTGNAAATDGGCSVGDGKHIKVTLG